MSGRWCTALPVPEEGWPPRISQTRRGGGRTHGATGCRAARCRSLLPQRGCACIFGEMANCEITVSSNIRTISRWRAASGLRGSRRHATVKHRGDQEDDSGDDRHVMQQIERAPNDRSGHVAGREKSRVKTVGASTKARKIRPPSQTTSESSIRKRRKDICGRL